MISLIAAIALRGQANLPAIPLPTKVVVTVNGHSITAGEIQAYLWDWNAQDVGRALTLLEEIRQEAAKDSVTVTPAEIQEKVNAQIQQLMAHAPKGTSQESALRAAGGSRTKLEMGVRAQLTLEKIAIKSFKPADFIRVATLIIRPKSEAAADVQTSLTKGNDAYAALAKGDAWEKVLPAYASEPGSVPNNGELGWVNVNDFPPTTRTEVMSLKIGSFTKPVQTPNGIQIFKLEAKGKDASPGELTDVRTRYLQAAERDIVERLQKDSKVSTNY